MLGFIFQHHGLHMGIDGIDSQNLKRRFNLVGALEHFFFFPYLGNNHPN